MSFSRPTSDKEKEILQFVKFNRAAERDDVDKVRMFLKRYPQVPRAVLSTAVWNKHYKIVDLLLSLPDLELTAKELQSAFGDAILNRNESLALRFLDRGADSNEPITMLKETPLILAAQRGMHALIKRLIEKGARIDAQDASILSEMLGKPLGKTALMHASEKGDEDTALLLISYGCDTNARGESGITALDYALRSKKRDNVAILLRKTGSKTGKELDALASKPRKVKEFPASINKLPPRLSLDDAAEFMAERFSFVRSQHPCVKGVMLLSDPDNIKRKRNPNRLKPILGKVFEAFLSRGLHIFVTWDQNIPPCIAVVSAQETIQVVKKFRTANANYGVTNKALLKFLGALHRKYPLAVIGCGGTFVECRFEQPVKNSAVLAKKLFDFCPFVVSEHQDKITKFARHLEQERTFCFWWD